MATEYEVRRLLREVAQKLIGRNLNEQETEKLYKLYLEELGTPYNKTIKALSKFSALSETQIFQKRASSDDLDRVMQDLRTELEGK